MADVALVGFPNAGKSTFISVISAAKPKIADYPFTTLEPNLGVVKLDDDTDFVVADIPGLIEGASEGRGLGHQFLRHVERARVMCVMVDLASVDEVPPAEQERILLHELAEYRPELLERPRIVVGTKADAIQADDLATLGWDGPIMSAITHQGVSEVVGTLASLVHEARQASVGPGGVVVLRPDASGALVERIGDGEFRLVGRDVERVVALNDVTTPEALSYIDFRLERLGVPKMLAKAGAQEGDVIWIGEFSFDYQPDSLTTAEPDMRVVAKIGTASITDDRGAIDGEAITKLCGEVAALRARGHEIIVVSSGAVAAGVLAVGLPHRPSDMATLQAISAAGQGRLVEAYNAALSRHGLVAAQVLLDPYDFVDRTQYLHARRTLVRLLELGCIPVINENDAIANHELRYGDNDRLAALVANSVGADLLVLLTDTDGVYTADPRRDPSARLVARVTADDPLLSIAANSNGSGRGSGGMASKLTAARIASWSGIRSVIARAAAPDVLARAVGGAPGDAGAPVGTTFDAHARTLPARKLWIAFAAEVEGTLQVDAGAERALLDGPRSLLPAGVVAATGSFVVGDTVDIVGPSGRPFARGMVAVDARAISSIAGMRTHDLPPEVAHEVVHRDDLVVLP